MPNMMLFKIITYLAFPLLLAGKSVNIAAIEVVDSAATASGSGGSSRAEGKCHTVTYHHSCQYVALLVGIRHV